MRILNPDFAIGLSTETEKLAVFLYKKVREYYWYLRTFFVRKYNEIYRRMPNPDQQSTFINRKYPLGYLANSGLKQAKMMQPKPALAGGELPQDPLKIFAGYIPFAALCAFLLLAPILPDVKLTRPKLLITETSLYGALFMWIAVSFYSGALKLRKSLFNAPVIMYAASVAVFFFFSPDKPVALNELKRSFLSVTAYFVAANLIDSAKKRNIALGFFLAGTAAAVLYGIMQHYGGLWIIQVPQFGRAISTFGNPIFFAAYLVLAIPVILGAMFYAKNKLLKAALLLLFASGTLAVYFTQTRAAFIALGFAIGLFIFLAIKESRKIILFIAILTAALVVLGASTRNIWSRQQAHTLIWRDSLMMWADSPFFGTGPGTFHIYFPKYASPELKVIWPQEQNIINDAHNEYIQYLAEMGIVGFGIFD